MFQMNRLPMRIGAEHFKTYQISAPIPTHFRRASCREADCQRYQRGFRTKLDTSDPRHAGTAKWIENKSGRKFTRAVAGTIVEYTFPPGQKCFEPHLVSLQREALFIVRDGDFRGNPRGTRPVVRTASAWVEDFGLHQDRLAEALKRG